MKELKETAPMMNSLDYKERFLAEYFQLKIRYEKLETMIENWDAGILKFAPTCPRAIYNFQLRAMKDYLDTLIIRAKLENINLD